MKIKELPPVEWLRDHLDYNPHTGELRWKITAGGHIKAGELAGCVDPNGYHIVRLLGSLYKSHRICWAIFYGEDPHPHLIDHKEGKEAGNGINNLRLVTYTENNFNCKLRKTNTSGFRGVSFNKMTGKWSAYIRRGGRQKTLGYFTFKEDAIAARLKAEEEYNIFVRD